MTRGVLCAAFLIGGLLSSIGFAATPELLVRVGDDSPLGRPFSTLSDAVIDDQERLAFIGTSGGLFRRTGTDIDGLLVAGDNVAGGSTIAALGTPELGEPGCSAFVASFAGGSTGVVRLCDGVAEVVVKEGDLAPGNLPIVGFGSSVGYGVGGEIAFVAQLSDGSTALIRKAGSTLVDAALSETPAPTGGTFTGFRPIGVTATGNVGFFGTVRDNPDGVFLWNANTQQILPVVGVNSPSPGSGSFSRIGGATMNAAAQFAFRATTTVSGGGVFRVDAGTLGAPITVLAKEGDSAPVNESNGDRTATFRNFPTSMVPSINATGQVAFRALIGDSQYNAGIFLAEANGALASAVIAGQPGAINLTRLRDPGLADDGSMLVPAGEPGAGSGLYVVRDGRPSQWMASAGLTSVGTGYRFLTGRGRARAEDAIAFGQREGVFLAVAGSVLKIALLDEPTPIGGKFTGFSALAGGVNGVAFQSAIDAGRSSEGVFTSDGSVLRAVARTDRRVPGGKLVSFFSGIIESVGALQAESAGTAFQALLQGGKASSGLFIAGRGGVRAIALQGRRADRGKFNAFGSFDVVKGSSAVFTATRSGGPSPGVFLRAGGRTRLLAGAGRSTGTRALGNFAGFDGVDAGTAGIAFHATLREPASQGIFVADKKSTGAVALAQDPAPGGGRFVDFGPPAVTADAVVYVASVAEGTVRGGLYRAPLSGVPTPDQIPASAAVLALGDTIPGGVISRISQPRANRTGALALVIDLRGGDTSQGLYRLAP